jgi:hypothetical protein
MTSLAAALTIGGAGLARGQQRTSWLDAAKPMTWNVRRASIPAAPRVEGAIDPRCRAQARPAQSEADRRVHSQGWELVGAYQGGWQMLVVEGTAGYDGMCRPRLYQAFVFVRGVFAGTLSPQPMDSRTDGALSRVTLADKRITAEYLRYLTSDPLCCASRTAIVVFDVTSVPLVVPVAITHAPLSRGAAASP